MPNYIHKETGELKRFPSVRISWDSETGDKKEVCLETNESILENYVAEEVAGNFEAIKMKKAFGDGRGTR